jgi:hypothetical protein
VLDDATDTLRTPPLDRSLASARLRSFGSAVRRKGLKMRRNFRIGAAVASVLLVASVAVASGASSGDNRSTEQDGRKVVVLDLAVKLVETDTVFIDAGPTDPNTSEVTPDDEGDGFVLHSELSHKGQLVGEESNICTFASVEPDGGFTVLCTGVDSLPGGQITWQSRVRYGPGEPPKPDPYFQAIVGGTGKYRTAHGEIRVQELSLVDFRYSMRIIL